MIDIDPNSNDLPGIEQLRTIVGAVLTVGLILSATVWAYSANPASCREREDRRPDLRRRHGDLRRSGRAGQLLLVLLGRRPERVSGSSPSEVRDGCLRRADHLHRLRHWPAKPPW
ncbi:hypothetical protein [Amycolatopsis ultiminotia]|uniref:hypothetical protein n=1 Tax=Amycolatopsis ultiminotia TaxID=543629 RepID=UPI003CD097E6